MGPESLGFMVNSALLGAVGLDPQGKDLRTWDDFTRAAQKLTKGGGMRFSRSASWRGTSTWPGSRPGCTATTPP